MKSLNYIKNRVEFAAAGNKRLTVDHNFVNALNDVIEFVNGKQNNEDAEDALMLFYLLQVWKIDNEKNRVKHSENRQGMFTLSNPYITLQDLILSVRPKENIIDEIYTEIRAHQLYNRIPKGEMIKKTEVRKLIEGLLKDVRNFKTFPMIKAKRYVYG